MQSTKPVMVNREKTILIEANEKQSRKYESGNYETVLSKGIEINNGDVITLESAFIDTSDIDPSNVFLPEDVKITWNNGLYLINQQLTYLCPSSTIGVQQVITDNNPIVLSQFHPAADVSGLYLWTSATVTADSHEPGKYGGIDVFFQITDVHGTIRRQAVFIPEYNDTMDHVYGLDLVSRTEPIAIDPYGNPRNEPVKPPDYAFYGVGQANIHQAIKRDSNAGTTSAIKIPITGGYFSTVINDGTFTIPSGTYEPVHLAKLLTDGFDKLNPERDFSNPVPRNHHFPFRMNHVSSTVSTLQTIDFNEMPFDDSLNALVGWNATMTYRTNNLPKEQDGEIHTVNSTVIPSITGDIANSFRVPLLDPPFPSAPDYPGGGAVVILTPPDGYYDKGSAFLQSTENYSLTGADGGPIYAFTDTQRNRNVLTYKLDPPYFWMGSNNIEVSYDADQKRFRFNYMHFPLTSGEGSGPAVINQVAYSFQEDEPIGIPAEYVRDTSKGGINITSKAYGGVFFTALEPFTSFWQDTLGFESSMIAKINGKSIPADYNTGIPFGGVDEPTNYENITMPKFTITPGINTTEQLFVLGDLTGKPANYTGAGYAPYSLTAAPDDNAPGGGDGRVAVSPEDVVPIIAGQGTQLGKQSSGYYIVDIDVGTTYNENIGSDSIQTAYSRNIRGIIDRYYSANSYTSSQGNGISYVHYGNSFTLGSIKVRIKNSDGSDVTDLGNDNAIFLKVLKNQEINISPDPVIPKT